VIGELLTVPQKQTTILLLSSDSDIRAVLQEVLEAQGDVVLPASDLSRAVDWLGRCTPDLLIVSPYLSGISGYEAALYLRTKCNGLRILMVDGFLEDERIQYRASLKKIEVFPKPFTAAEFLQKVSDVLASTRETA
jgi:DNA-binding response OmpR family regulator